MVINNPELSEVFSRWKSQSGDKLATLKLSDEKIEIKFLAQVLTAVVLAFIELDNPLVLFREIVNGTTKISPEKWRKIIEYLLKKP